MSSGRNAAVAGSKKPTAARKDYELLKPIKVAGEQVKPAEDGKPAVMVRLRDDQADRLGKSGHIKLSA